MFLPSSSSNLDNDSYDVRKTGDAKMSQHMTAIEYSITAIVLPCKVVISYVVSLNYALRSAKRGISELLEDSKKLYLG
jgi:hypothetical protein